MKNTLKVYDIELTARGPIYIGSGNELKKNEYFSVKGKKVIVPRLDIMYQDICRMNKQRSYENYMLRNNRDGLSKWLYDERIPDSYIEKWKSYELDCGDYIEEKGKQLKIMTCIKDPYGNPYIPGSSLKGMLRTILLAYDIRMYPQKYASIKSEIEKTIRTELHPDKKKFLSRQIKKVEIMAFNTLQRPDTSTEDAVNDYMSGLIISDSEPLSMDDLTLCQKIDKPTDGLKNNLPILRESIKPDTQIHFTMTIDTSLCKIDDKYIMDSVADFVDVYYEMFKNKYKGPGRPVDNTIWLGGGAGFVSKTVIYSMFGEDGVHIVPEIFGRIGVTRKHKHYMDKELGVSPHMLKVSRYKGKLYEFGKCRIKITENI